MTEELFEKFIKKIHGKRPDDIRLGQFAMNCLYDFDKNLYQESTDIEVDPFYDDEQIEPFIEFIKSKLIKINVVKNDTHVAFYYNDNSLFPIAVAEMDLVGSLFDSIEGHHWWISRVLVQPNHRRKGIGKEIVSKLISHHNNYPLIVCPGGYNSPHEEQVLFYKSCGFVELSSNNDVLVYRIHKDTLDSNCIT